MKTVNNIFQLFQLIAEKHFQINGFVYGDITEVESYDKLRYPLLIVSPITSEVGGNVITHSYRLSISDLVKKDDGNQVEVWSDTQQILTDLVKIFRFDSEQFELINDPILTPFKEKWGDDVSGWQGDFEIEFDFNNTQCGVPIDEFLVPGPTEKGYFPSCIDVSSLCDVEINSPTDGQILVYQNGKWVNQNNSSGLNCESISECELIQGIEDDIFSINETLLEIQNNFNNFLPLSGGTMDSDAIIKFNSAIDIQSNNVTDYSKSWYYGDDNLAQMGFGFNHYLNATTSLIELVALANNSIYQVIADSDSENLRMVANKNGELAEFIVKPGLAATYRNNNNLPINYHGDYSANFTPLSLVNKGHIDNLLTDKADLVDGKVPANQLPSFVDDVLEYDDLASFPLVGEDGKIYVAKDSNKTYRWTGSSYASLDSGLALGETSSTAYRGDRGKIAYDHSQTTGNPHGTNKSDIGLSNVDNTSDANKPVSIAQQEALDLKANIIDLPVSGTGYRKFGIANFERWYVGNGNSSSLSTITIGRNNIQYMPLVVGKTCTLASVGINITGAGTAGALMTIAIYNSSNNIPTSRIVDCGTLLVDTLGAIKITGLSTVLVPGLYFFAINHNSVANVSMSSITVAGCEPIFGFANTLGSTPGTFYSNTSSTYSAPLPLMAITPTTVGITTPPAIYFYLSA